MYLNIKLSMIQDFLSMVQRPYKVISSTHLQTGSNHSLGKILFCLGTMFCNNKLGPSILAYTLEAARVGLNSLTFRHVEKDSYKYMWTHDFQDIKQNA